MAKKSPAYDTPEAYGVSDRGEGKTPRIRHDRPDVAKHCARMILRANGDYESAVATMVKAEFPDATEAQIVSIARTLEKSPHIRREMQALLEEIGYGDEALKKFIGSLWDVFITRDPKLWPTAARLLSEIMDATKKAGEDKKVPILRLGGMEAGLARMLGNSAPTNTEDAPVPAIPELDTLESDDDGIPDSHSETTI